MKRLLKTIVFGALNKLGKRLEPNPHYAVKGYKIDEDLATIINNRSPICLDVGANVGQTIEMLVDSLDNPKVFSFEPSTAIHQALADKIRQNLPKWNNVELFKLALGEAPSELEFKNYGNTLLSSFLDLADDTRNPFHGNKDTVTTLETVEVSTVDRFVQEHNLSQIDLLKIDTQGFDLNVLKGAKKSFEQGLIKNVFLEMNFCPLYDKQGSPSQMIDFLAQYDFQLVDIYEKYRSHGTPHLSWCSGLFSILNTPAK